MESSFRLFRVRGIEIGANWSWLIIVGLLIWVLSGALFPATYPNLDRSTYLGMGVAAVVLFVISLLLHELGHALRALKEGMEIEGITLWLFGGVARFKGMFPSAGAEFRIAIAGPLVTLVLFGFFLGITWAFNQADASEVVVGVTDYLARINLVLLLFNMVPALPLDGGRVLRAYLWHAQGNFTAATKSAARAGRAFGVVLIAVGVLGLISGAGFFGIWLAFIGWFLMQAAQAETMYAHFSQALRGLRVRNLMTPEPESVDPHRSVADFIEHVAHVRGHSTYPVLDHGRLAGLVSLRMAAQVPADRRATTTIGDVMMPRDEVPTVQPEAEVMDAVATLQGGPGRALVVEDGRVLGILSASDVARTIEVEQIRGPRAGEPRARRAPILVWIIVGGLILGAGGTLYTPPVVVFAPGEAFDIAGDISIDGVPTHDVSGEYVLTSVSVNQPNGIGLALAFVRGREVAPISALVPRDVPPDEFFERQRALFAESQMIAAAAAARVAGLEVDLSGTGASVAGVLPGLPAADVLQEGDVITAIDGVEVRVSDEVGRIIRARPAGTTFELTVERQGREEIVDVRSRAGVVEGEPGIGIAVVTRDFDIDLPFAVDFRQREVGGPSAGLTYALAVYDMLTEDDLADGRSIATTGTIDLEGRVGAVGGLEEKAITAQRAQASIFIVPEAEVRDARGQGLDVIGVATLENAVAALRG